VSLILDTSAAPGSSRSASTHRWVASPSRYAERACICITWRDDYTIGYQEAETQDCRMSAMSHIEGEMLGRSALSQLCRF